MMNDRQTTLVQVKANAMFECIVNHIAKRIMAADEKPLQELTPEELRDFVEEQFEFHRFLDYLVSDRHEDLGNVPSFPRADKITLPVTVSEPFRNVEEVMSALENATQIYVDGLEKSIRESKKILYARLRARQDTERLKLEVNPYD